MRISDRLQRIKWRKALLPLAWLILVTVVIYMYSAQAAAIERQRILYESLSESYTELYEEAVVAGADPESPAPEDVPEPDDSAPQIDLPRPEPSPGPSGPRGPGPTPSQVVQALSSFCAINDCTPTPTVAQVAAAIADYCAGGKCQGTDGSDGKNGRPPTAEEIGSAVSAYCADGSCRGEDGKNATDEQVRVQVTAYCEANNFCQGPIGDTGERGATGEPGPAGVGIKSITCPSSTDDWLITYTDDTTQTVIGPCRTDPIVEPPGQEG